MTAFGNSAGLNTLDQSVADLLKKVAPSTSGSICRAASLTSFALRQGHVCLDLKAENPGLPPWKEFVRELRSSDCVGSKEDPKKPLILSSAGKLYFHRYWHYEQQFLRNIETRMGHFEELREAMHGEFTAHLGSGQRQAVTTVARSRLTLISGGPGTGKTTTILYLLGNLLRIKKEGSLKIALAAPTGKAAQRLQASIRSGLHPLPLKAEQKEAIPVEVTTIHRLLGYRPHSPDFKHNRTNPLVYDVVVVDEASMLDLLLFSKLLEALKPETRLILLGDSHQLASVDAGSVFGDLSLAATRHSVLKNHLVELTQNYRFGDSSSLYQTCEYVKLGQSGKALEILKTPNPEIKFCPLPSPAKLPANLEKVFLRHFLKLANSGSPGNALRLINDSCLLTPLRKGPYGVEGLNAAFENILRKRPENRGYGRFFPGMPIIINQNHYRQNLYNGDIGILLENPEKPAELHAYFDDGAVDQVRRLPLSSLPAFEPAFALTVHKSQGSEYGKVVCLLPPGDSPLMTRELIYTAISRSKGDVEIWGSEAAFEKGVSRKTRRTSGILDFLKET